jgi:hypothetical protein
MKRHLTTFLAVAMLGCAGHAWAQKPQPTVLTNAQLKALLSKGMTARITGADRPNTAKRSGTAVYQKDGTVRFNEGAATTTHIGSWRIDGNKFCTKYTNLGSGCFNVQKTGETTYKLIPLDGLLEGTWEVQKK